VNWLLAIPLELRLVFLFVLGALLGSLANLAAYRLAWHARSISPWSSPDPRAKELKIPPRRLFDLMPIWGWLGLTREVPLHGRGFWIRPMLVELACAFGLAWLYWWEIDQVALLPAGPGGMMPAGWMPVVHVQFAVHAFLIWLMLAASLIDADEKTIPDAITVPGTLLALLIATVYPLSLLPALVTPFAAGGVPNELGFITITAPNKMPIWLDACPATASLLIAMGCWCLACFALMRRDWYTRHGWARAFTILCARLRREPSTWWLCAMALVGCAAIAAVWAFSSAAWAGLITALVGMAAAGGLIWAIRIIASAVLRREAMGFGDVTLMAMLGAFLGWQACLIIFFFAPIVALIVGLIVLVLKRDNEIPYGPFLCLSALFVVIRWSSIWQWAELRFELGVLIPSIIIVCLVLLAVLLALLQVFKSIFTRMFLKT